MNKTFGLLFYVKKTKMIANGTAPVYSLVVDVEVNFNISNTLRFRCCLRA